MGVRGQHHAAAAFPPREDPVPILQEEAGWDPGPFWTGAENLVPSGIRSLNRPSNKTQNKLCQNI